MTAHKWKLALSAFVLAAGLATLAGVYIVVTARSQALLDDRQAKPFSAVRAAATPETIAQGAMLSVVTACISCHGSDLTGHMLQVAGSQVYAPNLTIAGKRLSDADLDRAIRRGLRPDGVSELAMPAHAYAGFTDDEVASIIGYLRGLPVLGTTTAQPRPGLLLRANLLAGLFKTETDRLAVAGPPLDAGPRFEAGRHLATVACGQCHGTDLGGAPGAPGPDLTLRGYYDRAQFRTLMRTGEAVGEGDMELMSRTAVSSFSHFSDSEIDAIFDYLYARDRILSAQDGRGSGR